MTGENKRRMKGETEEPPAQVQAPPDDGEAEEPAGGAEEGRAKSEVESYRESLMRLQAEFENFRKRQARERDEYRRSAAEKVIKALLPVLDNLERAVGHADGSDVGKLLEGLQLVAKQFREEMEGFGVKPIIALGEPFDPHLHEAMSRVETDGDPPDGTVVEEYQKGYLLNGRVLRPAMVGVAKLVDEAETGEPD